VSRAYNNVEKLRDIVSVLDYGAVGNGVADDTAALQAAFNSGRSFITFEPGANYKTTDTVTLPAQISVDFQTAKITYAGARDRPAMVVGAQDIYNSATLKNIRIISSVLDWSNTGFIGLRTFSMNRTSVHVMAIENFTIGFELYSLGAGYQHVIHEIVALTSCKYSMVLTCDGASTPGEPSGFSFINENTFIGGDMTNFSSTNALGSSYGVWLRQINNGYAGHNNNVWYHPCFQPGDGAPGDERIPFFFDNVGNHNIVHAARHEGGRGPFAKLVAPAGTGSVYTGGGTTTANVVGNILGVGYASGNHVVFNISETGSARLNIYVRDVNPWFVEDSYAVRNIGNLAKAYSATQTTMLGGLHLTDITGVAAASIANVQTKKRSLQLSTGGNTSAGFFVKTDGNENFIAYGKWDVGSAGRIGIAAYDANFAQLTNVSATYPDVMSVGIETGSFDYIFYKTDFGGCYIPTADASAFIFRLSSAVKYIRVFVSSGAITSIGIHRLTRSVEPLQVFSGLNTNDAVHYASANPDTGITGVYARGDIAYNATATAGSPSYWQCTTAGRIAPAWIISTAYTVGVLALNDTNKIYECVTAGTSAGSGGPTGTGSAITDGTVVWNYLSPKAVFAEGANL
jgi:hypothetical protein